MKIERLEVSGFGGLRDVTVDFHPRLTLIAGDNESGKSTLHRAIRAALYGIDAGGQGRPVERSEWYRWTPWTPGLYGLALTYTLHDGRRIRVARSLDTRDQGVQVLELGGSDLTDELRSGRAVSPGRFHLGIDEPVFCATAWLGDDALRLGAPDAAPARAEQLQEAIERLADSTRGVTATQAIARLRQALDRVGSERRVTSPLGVASARLRDLDRQLDEARRRLGALAAEEERLRELERSSQETAKRAVAAERAWLECRIAHVVDRRRRLDALRAEAAEALEEQRATRERATFPLELEERAATLAGELAHAMRNAAESRTSWDAAQERLREVSRRRAEVASGLEAMKPLSLDDGAIAEAQQLQGELAALAAAEARLATDPAAGKRAAALRTEIARTGLGALPLGSADALTALLEHTRRRPRPALWLGLAVACLAAGALAGALLLQRHALVAGLGFAAAGLVLAAVACAWFRRAVLRTRELQVRITELEAAAGVGAGDAALVAERVPSLQALHAALLVEEARAQTRRSESEAVHGSALALLGRCAALLDTAGLPSESATAGATTKALLEQTAEGLAALRRAAAAQRRRGDLEREEHELAAEEADLARLGHAAERYATIADRLHEQLAGLLTAAGLVSPDTPSEAVATVREACELRRRHDDARRVLASAQQRAAVLGDEAMLDRALAQLSEQLEEQGGSATAARELPAPDDAVLQRMEEAARRAVQAAAAELAQARELRARLAGLLESTPDVADLENERDAYAAARARGLRQAAALTRAIQLIDDASRATHRDLAPQLAERVAERLSLLTDARYGTVNVDTEHFAVSLLSRQRPEMLPLEVVSHGTRDQVSLLLRIALCEVLSTSGEAIPLLLDEPMLTADPARRDLMLEFLQRLSETNQVVVTTSEPAVVEAASRAGADFAVVRLPAASADLQGRGARVRVV